jgi:glutathione synthase/RimK-type ligase-like ATP-grasp enzyme
MAKILITMNEDVRNTRADTFAVTYTVDEHDCLDYAAALEARGHDVFFVNWNHFHAGAFQRMFSHNQKRFVAPLPLGAIDLIWVYQMEGFYAQLSRFFEMIAMFEEAGARIVNDPRTIRHNAGKHYLWALAEKGVRVIPTYDVDANISKRLGAGERFVLKPLFGERGAGVFLASRPHDLERIDAHEEHYIAQEYMPSVREGERSLVFLGLEFQHAVLKRPARADPGEFRCNESLGGTVSVYEPTAAELRYATDVLRAYESLGCPVHYSRIDFIQTANGPALMEAELLNPAAFANYSGKGTSFGEKVAEYLERLICVHASTSASPTLSTNGVV